VVASKQALKAQRRSRFQWAPTLGGECYNWKRVKSGHWYLQFQWAPTFGGECYRELRERAAKLRRAVSMGTHPWG